MRFPRASPVHFLDAVHRLQLALDNRILDAGNSPELPDELNQMGNQFSLNCRRRPLLAFDLLGEGAIFLRTLPRQHRAGVGCEAMRHRVAR